jgi:DNA-binding XRE family transcriptional regulator
LWYDGKKENGVFRVGKKEFSTARQYLGKTQSQMAQLLGVSLKAIQSFEQGWRNIPIHIERQVLFLLASKKSPPQKERPCWVIRKCLMEIRQNCPAWEFQVGNLCWFINGTICQGRTQESWQKKMKICRQCKVFQTMVPSLKTELRL